ncbi:hypothetical protein PCE1_003445 [Barthelona sp. PCE]
MSFLGGFFQINDQQLFPFPGHFNELFAYNGFLDPIVEIQSNMLSTITQPLKALKQPLLLNSMQRTYTGGVVRNGSIRDEMQHVNNFTDVVMPSGFYRLVFSTQHSNLQDVEIRRIVINNGTSESRITLCAMSDVINCADLFGEGSSLHFLHSTSDDIFLVIDESFSLSLLGIHAVNVGNSTLDDVYVHILYSTTFQFTTSHYVLRPTRLLFDQDLDTDSSVYDLPDWFNLVDNYGPTVLFAWRFNELTSFDFPFLSHVEVNPAACPIGTYRATNTRNSIFDCVCRAALPVNSKYSIRPISLFFEDKVCGNDFLTLPTADILVDGVVLSEKSITNTGHARITLEIGKSAPEIHVIALVEGIDESMAYSRVIYMPLDSFEITLKFSARIRIRLRHTSPNYVLSEYQTLNMVVLPKAINPVFYPYSNILSSQTPILAHSKTLHTFIRYELGRNSIVSPESPLLNNGIFVTESSMFVSVRAFRNVSNYLGLDYQPSDIVTKLFICESKVDNEPVSDFAISLIQSDTMSHFFETKYFLLFIIIILTFYFLVYLPRRKEFLKRRNFARKLKSINPNMTLKLLTDIIGSNNTIDGYRNILNNLAQYYKSHKIEKNDNHIWYLYKACFDMNIKVQHGLCAMLYCCKGKFTPSPAVFDVYDFEKLFWDDALKDVSKKHTFFANLGVFMCTSIEEIDSMRKLKMRLMSFETAVKEWWKYKDDDSVIIVGTESVLNYNNHPAIMRLNICDMCLHITEKIHNQKIKDNLFSEAFQLDHVIDMYIEAIEGRNILTNCAKFKHCSCEEHECGTHSLKDSYSKCNFFNVPERVCGLLLPLNSVDPIPYQDNNHKKIHFCSMCNFIQSCVLLPNTNTRLCPMCLQLYMGKCSKPEEQECFKYEYLKNRNE